MDHGEALPPEVPPPSRPAAKQDAPRRRVGLALALCGMLPATCAMIGVEQHLLENRTLNTRDLGPIGGEQGTFAEYLLNIWVWDGVLLLLTLLSLVALPIGVWLLVRAPRASLHGADDERSQAAAPR